MDDETATLNSNLPKVNVLGDVEQQPSFGGTAGAHEMLPRGRPDDYDATTTPTLLLMDDRPIQILQQCCHIFSHVAALLAIVTVIHWVHQLGGTASLHSSGQAKLVFNWHPLLMTTAFCFMTVASLSFRCSCYTSWNRFTLKLVHGMAWLIAALCAAVALVAVFRSHNDAASGYIANLYSLHSWIGATVIVFYIVQFVTAFFTFGWTLSWITPLGKAKVLRVHLFAGPTVYLLTAATILLGIQEKEGFVGCAYKVDQPDLWPIQHIAKIPAPCRTSHTLGLLILATALSTSIALYNFSSADGSRSMNNDRRGRGNYE